MINYICNECDRTYPHDTLEFKCACGGLFNLEPFDLDFRKNSTDWSMFRYFGVLPLKGMDEVVTMGEGMTALVPYDSKHPNWLLKMDYMMPTLSFKDRGAAVLVTLAKRLGVKKVIQDSSGNAGTAIAAYAARAGIPCEIFVPGKTSPKKIQQIKAHGAKVVLIQGSREETAKAAYDAASDKDAFYASHVYNPYFYQGTKTFGYEVFEQLKDDLPESFILPVGNGTLVLGVYYALCELLDAHLIKQMSKIIAVQSEYCAPIHYAFHNESDPLSLKNNVTLAEGIAIAEPKREKQILEAIRSTGGDVILAPEHKIAAAKKELADRGFFVETTTAATFAGFFDYIVKHPEQENDRFVLPLCGAGLKSE
ncbi:MAG: pyridoxal-phosphate dependent enzyme [Clostridia bacterium]|nr:pyridoxal-phosphate dependent enzyme [Clostridia bacterium]